MEKEDRNTFICCKCKSSLYEPYIICLVCTEATVKLCLNCFAKGVEFDSHESDHAYTIIKNDFSLYEGHWTAAEEQDLLKALSDCGYGNWADVAQRLRTKTKAECERHYNKCYINNPESPLECFEDPMMDVHPQPFVYKLCDDPPRYTDHSSSALDMGGYMAARGDFTVEYDNFQELEIVKMDFDEEEGERDDLMENLKLAALDVYMNCLKERQRRKKIIRDHGIINLTKVSTCNRRFDKTIKDTVEKIRCFMHLFTPHAYDKYVEGLHLEQETRNQIKKLQEYRENGLTSLHKAKLYRVLNRRHRETKSKIHLLDDLLLHVTDEKACQTFLQRQAILDNISKGGSSNLLPNLVRRSAPPLDIMGLPGYDRIDHEEREVCAAIRLVPEAYIEFRNALINECRKNGCLKLSQARNIIKIDVNKTRRLYDFLISKGSLNRDHH